MLQPSPSFALPGEKEQARPDGRQSEAALIIRRGLTMMLHALDETVAYEVPLPNGRRADVMSLSPKGQISCFEIKSSRQDFLSDGKWPDYREYCDHFAFATGPDVDRMLFPETEGLYIADYDGALQIRPAHKDLLPASRRKAMLIRLVRCAQRRLMVQDYPFLAAGL
jgi:hypothetical protein